MKLTNDNFYSPDSKICANKVTCDPCKSKTWHRASGSLHHQGWYEIEEKKFPECNAN